MLSLHQGNGMQTEYVQCADGRTRFTSGWDKFALHNDLIPGLDVMMMFYTDKRHHVIICMHVLYKNSDPDVPDVQKIQKID